MNKTHTRNIILSGEVGEEINLRAIEKQTKGLAKDVTIVFEINSFGGQLYEALDIAAYIQSLVQNTISIVNGVAASAATVISLACKERKIVSGSKFLVHNPFFSIIRDCNLECMEEHTKLLRVSNNELLSFYVANTQIESDKLKTLLEEDKFLTSGEALELGFVDSFERGRKLNSIENKKAILNMSKDVKSSEKSLLKKAQDFISSLINGKEDKEETKPVTPEDVENKTEEAKAEVKNMIVELEGGQQIYIMSEDGKLLGKEVYLAEDGEMLEEKAPDGVHTFDSEAGTIQIETKGGVITSVSMVEAMEEEEAQSMEEGEMVEEAEGMPKEEEMESSVEDISIEELPIENKTQEQVEVENKETMENKDLVKILAEALKAASSTGVSDTPKAQPKAVAKPHKYDALAQVMNVNRGSIKRAIRNADSFTTGFDYTYPGILTEEIFEQKDLSAPNPYSMFQVRTGIKRTLKKLLRLMHLVILVLLLQLRELSQIELLKLQS
jgi:ATP-dependent protease ClpP protease subunit